MYGREELKFCWGEAFLDCDVYEKEEADKVMDSMEAKIKELELALSNSREHEKALRKCFDNHRQRIKELEKQLEDVQNTMATENTDLGMENFKLKERVKELEATISKMETTTHKWISVNDRPPTKGQHVLVARTHRSLYPIDVVCWSEDYITHDIVTHWMPLPPPPTTEAN